MGMCSIVTGAVVRTLPCMAVGRCAAQRQFALWTLRSPQGQGSDLSRLRMDSHLRGSSHTSAHR